MDASPFARVVCPKIRKRYSSGNASTVVSKQLAFPGKAQSRLLNWTVKFVKQPSMAVPVTYKPILSTCGPESAKKPLGAVKYVTGELKSSCSGGSCTVIATYEYSYSAKLLPKNRPWRYDLLTFAPKPKKPPYGPLPGIVVEVTKLPPQ
jgi:hypothetical protein